MSRKAASVFGFLGHLVRGWQRTFTEIFGRAGGVTQLLAEGLFHAGLAPFTGPRRLLAKHLFPLMSNVGARSLPIVAMVSFLMGAILVLQTGEPLRKFGQLQEVPGAVALALAREISPLMTAILMTARVGASFTAVLGSMKINEEILALETMGIRVMSYLVAPRFLSMLVMVPCLTVLSYLLGMAGGAMVARAAYGISLEMYASKTLLYLTMTDLNSGAGEIRALQPADHLDLLLLRTQDRRRLGGPGAQHHGRRGHQPGGDHRHGRGGHRLDQQLHPVMSDESPVVIEVEDVHKSFGTVHVLRGISFRVREGETLCILGASGDGKTTMLKVLMGALRPTPAGSRSTARTSTMPTTRRSSICGARSASPFRAARCSIR